MPKPTPHKSGGWLLQVSAGKDAQGNRLRPSEVFHGTYKDACRRLAEMQADVERQKHAGGKRYTLAEYAEEWLARQKRTKSATTYAGYARLLRNRIIPALGHHPLHKLTVRHVNLFLAELETWERQDGRAGALSANSRLKHYRMIHLLLQDAVYRGHIAANPAAAVRAPKAERSEARYYTEADLRELVKALACEPLRFRALITLALTTGLRRGELLALQWRHVDLARQRVLVEQSAYWVPGELQATKAPKTTASARVVPLTADTVELLTTWQQAQAAERAAIGDEWTGGDYVWTDTRGKWMSLDDVSKQFADFITRHALPSLTFHGLRHTAASLLLAGGIHVRAVSSLLGHAQVSTTLNIYSHVIQGVDEAAREVMGRALATESATADASDGNIEPKK